MLDNHSSTGSFTTEMNMTFTVQQHLKLAHVTLIGRIVGHVAAFLTCTVGNLPHQPITSLIIYNGLAPPFAPRRHFFPQSKASTSNNSHRNFVR